MKAAACVLMLVVCMPDPACAGRKAEQEACEAVKKKIRVIEARMRDGYSAAQGIRLEARLRDLKEQRYKLCR